MKFPYFAHPTEREDRECKQAQRQGEDRVTLRITLLHMNCQSIDVVHIMIHRKFLKCCHVTKTKHDSQLFYFAL